MAAEKQLKRRDQYKGAGDEGSSKSAAFEYELQIDNIIEEPVVYNTRMANVEQLEALVRFMEKHKELALGRSSRSKEGRSLAKRLWTECAAILNGISLDGRRRSPESWRIFYNEYKSKLLRKIKKRKSELQAAGAGPAIITLTPLQGRLYSLIGRDAAESSEGVRHSPLSGPEHNVGVAVHERPFSEYNTEEQEMAFVMSTDDPHVVSFPLEPASSTTVTSTLGPAISTDSADSTVLAGTAGLSGSVGPPPPRVRVVTRAPQRRRRNRRQMLGAQHRTEQEPNSKLEEAQRRLAELESQSAMAMLEQARATRTLAAAVDRLASVFSQPLAVHIPGRSSPPVRKRIKIVIPSDSDSN